MIGVKNLSGHKLTGRFNGQDFVFEADEKVTTPVSEDAARHIFGYGERDKSRALLRLGWIANGAGMEEALARLGKFQFLGVEEVRFKESEPTMELPRVVASAPPASDTGLSPEELAIAEGMPMQKPEGTTKKFAKQKR